MKLPLRVVRAAARLAPLAPLFLPACSSASSDVVGTSSAAAVSATTTYLLPVDDGVRDACRSTWTGQFCAANDAVAAGDACVSAYVASTGTHPACAQSAGGCFELLTTSTPCDGDHPIYRTAADCQAPVERTCAFYSACLEPAEPCGESGYAIGYGEKYCSRYDVDNTFSPAGIVWRDAVLHCLQEALVPILPTASTMTCDAITDFAFDSHPRCYTEGPSICFLPPSDVLNVVSVIDGKDLLSLRSAKQMASVAGTCVEQIGGAIFSLEKAPERAVELPADVRDPKVLGDRLSFWREIQARAQIEERASKPE